MTLPSRPVPPTPVPASWALEELDPEAAASVVFRESSGVPSLDIDAITREAYERGLEDGRRAGAAAEGQRLQPTLQALDRALASLRDESDKWIANAQENVSAIAIAVARQVIGHEVQADALTIDALVRQALAEFPLEHAVVVRLHPADLTMITAARVGTGMNAPSMERTEVQWLPDPRVTRGGCVVEGRDRIVDGRVDMALERLYRRLTLTDA
ncbi:MAG: hypothetical protein IT361_00140 [Gemmatimonadaceae bacterium]|nr:hypothetical protein [Gemmatimonadaceae bacterium]